MSKTIPSRKTELIKLMQENLKQRYGKNCGSIKCLDNNDYSLDTDIVSELIAIDAALKAAQKANQNDSFSDAMRNEALSRNKYTPQKPYPET